MKLGPCYAHRHRGQGREPFGVDHFSAGIEGYQIADIHSYLNQRGIAYRDYPSGKDLNVTDPDGIPDGIKVQLSADNTWTQLEGGTASPEPNQPTGAPPIFHATGLDHILLNVSRSGKIDRILRKNLRPGHPAQQQPNLVPGRQIPHRAPANARRRASRCQPFLYSRRGFRLRRCHQTLSPSLPPDEQERRAWKNPKSPAPPNSATSTDY